MTKRIRTYIYAAGTLAMIVLLTTLWFLSQSYSSHQLCNGIYVQVVDSANQKFVTAAELRNELGRLPEIARNTPVKLINTDSLERQLRVIDKIESVRVVRLTDGSLNIIVEPMRPVARVFDGDRSYYINKDGKRIKAIARYHLDVPIIMGHFNETDTTFTPESLLPLLDYINNHPRWSKLVTMVKVDNPRNILLVPPVRGLVFNIGSTDAIPDKFMRLERMLNEVLPQAGWERYDTISVKWRGQIVATRRIKERPDSASTMEEIHEKDDIETMTVGTGIAPGQALPGKKAKNEKPITPGAKQPAKQDNNNNKNIPPSN